MYALIISSLSLVIAACTFAAQFYFKWVPEIEKQKNHAKKLAGILADIALVAIQTILIFVLARSSGPVTRLFVVCAALQVAGSFTVVILIAFRRWMLQGIMRIDADRMSGMIDLAGRHLEHSGQIFESNRRHLEITAQHQAALRLIALAPALTADQTEDLKAILDGKAFAFENTSSENSIESGGQPSLSQDAQVAVTSASKRS